jgi:hypothetical protein
MPSSPYLAVKMEVKMSENRQIDEQRIISVFSILEWAEAFIIDRKSRGLSPSTCCNINPAFTTSTYWCNITNGTKIGGRSGNLIPAIVFNYRVFTF